MIDNPFETRSDSFYFVDGRLIMHNKAAYKVSFISTCLKLFFWLFSSSFISNSTTVKMLLNQSEATKINLDQRYVVRLGTHEVFSLRKRTHSQLQQHKTCESASCGWERSLYNLHFLSMLPCNLQHCHSSLTSTISRPTGSSESCEGRNWGKGACRWRSSSEGRQGSYWRNCGY